jgi:uncharacterized membrane protein
VSRALDAVVPPDEVRDVRRWAGPLMAALSLLALAIAGYLTWVKLAGTTPACAILSGCETVEQSRYAEFLGLPVAAFGMLGAAAMLAGSLVWWRHADRRALWLAYGVGLASLPIIGWLTYVELAVLHAVCIWCVTYAVLVIAAWIVSIVGIRASGGRA